jgi:hypothetical protein
MLPEISHPDIWQVTTKRYLRNSTFTVSIWTIVHWFISIAFSIHFYGLLNFNNEISFDEF